jgi:hypothetical protein
MIASPLIPGRLYSVRGCGRNLQIIAPHPCDAIRIFLELLEHAE